MKLIPIVTIFEECEVCKAPIGEFQLPIHNRLVKEANYDLNGLLVRKVICRKCSEENKIHKQSKADL
jgi:hypothetical protein